ncbi:MAG: transporter substrate-binding domain-containing protein [Candidatus Scalindua sp.]|nr:transporter substrate-binding domain-containing protein [Candidatus Scalindua sp.]
MIEHEKKIKEGPALKEIWETGKLRLGMYLNFEGLSFKVRGRLQGLEVEAANLLVEELSKIVDRKLELEIVDQEWSQIIKVLKDRKYHAVFSALIPNSMYDRYFVRYTRPYLSTGIVIVAPARDGVPQGNITEDVSSLREKRIIVINDPAARRVMRRAGIYVLGDDGQEEMSMYFPQEETRRQMEGGKRLAERHGQNYVEPDMIPVKQILQIDEMPVIYDMLARGEVDAGIIDLGIIWWVGTLSRRYAKRIHVFRKCVGPFIYSAVTNNEDEDLHVIIDKAIACMIKNPKYKQIVMKWHGDQWWDWGYTAEDFVKY